MNEKLLARCISFFLSSILLMVVEMNILQLNEPFWFLVVVNSIISLLIAYLVPKMFFAIRDNDRYPPNFE